MAEMLYPDFFIGKIQLYKQKMRKILWTIDSRFFFFIMFMLFYRHRGIMHTNEEKAT